MGPYLTRNFPNDAFTLFIVEQADKEPFNRAFLINVGIKEASRLNADIKMQCVIAHDVDFHPKFDGVPYNNCSVPIQLGSELEHFNWTHPYPQNAGGIVSLRLADWLTINGMSNDYQGWGGEDDDFYQRLKQNHLLLGHRRYDHIPEIARPPKGQGIFINIEGFQNLSVQKVVPQNNTTKFKHNHTHYSNNVQLLKSMTSDGPARQRWRFDGLSDLTYTVQSSGVIENGANETQGFYLAVHHLEVLASV